MNRVSAAIACPSRFTASDQPHPSSPSNFIDHGVQVQLQSRSLTASNSTCKLARLWPPSSPQHRLRTYSITASKCIPELLDLGFPVHLRSPSITASKFTHPSSQTASPNLPNYGLQVCTNIACKCIFKLAQSWPPIASSHSLDHGLQVHP
jgi:hypothetical protein